MSYIFLNLRSMTATCNRWDFWLFRRHHRYFLFRDNFFGSLRHLKDISNIIIRSYGTTGRKYFQEQKSSVFQRLRSVTNTCNRWDFRLFRRCHWHFLFRNNLFRRLGHLKDISKISLSTYEIAEVNYFQGWKSYIFLSLK